MKFIQNTRSQVTANFYKTAVVEYNPSTNSIEDYLKILSETEEVKCLQCYLVHDNTVIL